MLAVALVLPSLAWAAQPRVIAVGDVHGEFAAFTGILRDAGLLDARDRWKGGAAILVQLGDVPDRGTNSRAVLDLLMSLEKQARKKRGRVVSLLGNHEVMNIMGDLRYVSPGEYASFADSSSEKRRQHAYGEFVKWRQQRFPGEPAPAEAEWMRAHPPGFLEHRQAYGARGRYGAWLRQHDTVARLGDTLFVHGGLSPDIKEPADEVNARVRRELQAFDEYRQYLLDRGIVLPFFTLQEMTEAANAELSRMNTGVAQSDPETRKVLEEFLTYPRWYSVHPQGPLWFRGYDRWSDEEGTANIAAVLERHRARRVVVGHSAQDGGRQRVRFNGRVYLVDTGMLASYYPGGRPSALELTSEQAAAIYPSGREVLESFSGTPPSSHALLAEREPWGGGLSSQQPLGNPKVPADVRREWVGPDGQPLPFKNDQEVLDFLSTAKVVSMKHTAEGVTAPRKALLEKDGVRANAVFRDVDEDKPMAQMARGGVELGFRDSFIFEPAAYQLSLLLGTYNVPPATLRNVDGKSGSLQLWIEGAMTEGKRRKEGASAGDPLKYNQQLHNMNVIDNLVANVDRNTGNILLMPDSTVWLIDHTRAFRRRKDLHAPKMILQCERKLFQAIQQLDEGETRARLKPYLRPGEIDAMFKRRGKLVEYVSKLIQAQGEKKILFDVTAAVVTMQ